MNDNLGGLQNELEGKRTCTSCSRTLSIPFFTFLSKDEEDLVRLWYCWRDYFTFLGDLVSVSTTLSKIWFVARNLGYAAIVLRLLGIA